jgi:hypothetical protein
LPPESTHVKETVSIDFEVYLLLLKLNRYVLNRCWCWEDLLEKVF